MNNYGIFLAWQLAELRKSKEDEAAAKDTTTQAKSATSTAKEQTEFASQELQSARQEEIAKLERQIAEKKANRNEYILAANAKYYMENKRGELGMDAQTLAILGDTQTQLMQEEIDLLEERLKTERQGGVADLKFPLKLTLGILAVAGGYYYWRS